MNYLAVLHETHILSEDINTEIQIKNRCSSIKKLFNSTFLEYKSIQRIKYYPLLCRRYSQLKCFYFYHTENNDWQSYNQCQNGGQYFQDSEHCPSQFTCICPDCFYGDKCQFSTSDFMFSIDPILGYHIKLHVSINRQPLIIKITIAINTIMLIDCYIWKKEIKRTCY